MRRILLYVILLNLLGYGKVCAQTYLSIVAHEDEFHFVEISTASCVSFSPDNITVLPRSGNDPTMEFPISVVRKIYFPDSVTTPVFSLVAGTYIGSQNVTISCDTEGAAIYYTTDGTEPGNVAGTLSGTVYNSPITIGETTTLKAVAVKSGMINSPVVSATYTIQPLITTISGIWDFAESVETTATIATVVFNDWVVTGVCNDQVCVSDGQFGFVIYQSGHGFTVGDKLNGTVFCNVLLYQNHYAVLTGVHAVDFNVIPEQQMPMLTTSIDDLVLRNYGTPLDLGTLFYNGTLFEDVNGVGIMPCNYFNLDPNPVALLEANKQYHVKGVSIIQWENNDPIQQIVPRCSDDFEEITMETVATPTFSPVGGTYGEAISVIISSVTDDAVIYYTTDGTEPLNDSGVAQGTVYGLPFTIDETTIVKAVAVKTGMYYSAVATAIYTIETNCTDVGSNDCLGVILYPNPVDDYFAVESVGEECKMVIYSINGDDLFRTEYSSGSRVDVSFLEPGNYIVKVGDVIVKFVKK